MSSATAQVACQLLTMTAAADLQESFFGNNLQVNCESMPDGPANPYGVGFCATETLLRTEQEAKRNSDFAKSRIWKIKNVNKLNPMNGGYFPR